MIKQDRSQGPDRQAHRCPTPSVEQRAALSEEIALLLDRSGTILWSDVQAAQLDADPVGRTLADLLVPGDEDKASRFLSAAQDDGGSLSWELGILGSSGPMTVRFRGAPCGDARTLIVGAVLPGDYGGLAADAADLTSQLFMLHRETEQQRRKLEEALESIRQMQVTLIQGEKLRSLGMLVASIAHEVNNPLAFAVAGIEEADRISHFALALLDAYRSEAGAEVATLEADPEAQYLHDLRHTLADARDGMERVRTLVLDLRTFARVDEAEFKLVDLAATLRATLRIGGTAVGAGVDVKVELAEIAPLDCAPARLNQAVLNLFTNAVRAASPTGVVRVRLREVSDGAVVEVEDSGPGVPPALREQVFREFFTTHGSSGGMGLGLHLARETARAHGGELCVEGSDLGGAMFRMTLPRSVAVQPGLNVVSREALST